MKTLQKFTPEYLKLCQQMSSEEILDLLDQFKKLYTETPECFDKSSMTLREPKDLLQIYQPKNRGQKIQAIDNCSQIK